ncbi:MAG: Maf family protein [Anaerolineae bacterium]|nr:Maf family protein [Anaerolineae bacterium]MDW8172612.1 Maf family protein [Anaerolineae bacterium]
MADLILASGSPRRRALLAQLGLPFRVLSPDIDETPLADEAHIAYGLRLAQAKAQAVAERLRADQVVLAADTVVILAADTLGIDEQGEILGKPQDADEARAMLRRLRARTHLVCTAFCLLALPSGQQHCQAVQTLVTMRDYSDAEIDAYVASGDPFDKAGGYAIQHEGFAPVAHIQGSYDNVVGFPLAEIAAALRRFGLLS